ncbi:MAG: hypothetical protein ACRDL4_02015 [Thermoleophilaceae bacterium]
MTTETKTAPASDQADLAWVVNAYLISFGGLLLLAGRLGDLVGTRLDPAYSEAG